MVRTTERAAPRSQWAPKVLFTCLFLALAGLGSHARAVDNPLKSLGNQAAYEEYQVKAAFLIVFAKYTNWSDSALPPGSPITLGIVGEGPLATALQSMASEMIRGRHIVVRQFRNAAEVQPCQILYFFAAEEPLLSGLQRKLMAWNVLTVGETSRFLDLGGAMYLFNEGGRLRFSVNRAVLEQNGIRVEANALKLAKSVVYQRSNP